MEESEELVQDLRDELATKERLIQTYITKIDALQEEKLELQKNVCVCWVRVGRCEWCFCVRH